MSNDEHCRPSSTSLHVVARAVVQQEFTLSPVSSFKQRTHRSGLRIISAREADKSAVGVDYVHA